VREAMAPTQDAPHSAAELKTGHELACSALVDSASGAGQLRPRFQGPSTSTTRRTRPGATDTRRILPGPRQPSASAPGFRAGLRQRVMFKDASEGGSGSYHHHGRDRDNEGWSPLREDLLWAPPRLLATLAVVLIIARRRYRPGRRRAFRQLARSTPARQRRGADMWVATTPVSPIVGAGHTLTISRA